MALFTDRLNALQIEIVNLEFQKEIFLHSKTQRDVFEIRHELRAREARIAELRGHLDHFISALPETEQLGITSAIHNQQTRPFVPSLPPEMLSAVFKEGPVDSWSRTNFALSVSQVSRYWRETAIQTPFLWSGICLLPWRTGTGYQTFLQILLKRSQSHPLDIRLSLLASHNANSQRVWAALREMTESRSLLPRIPTGISQPAVDHCLQGQLGMFIPEVSRWRTFSYECDHGEDVSQIMGPLSNQSVPLLESFAIFSGATYGEPRNIFYGGAPKLSHVHFDGVLPLMCFPPVSSVTTLRLATLEEEPLMGKEFLDMLRYMMVLEALHLGGEVVDMDDLYSRALQGEYVEIATLRSLSFSAIVEHQYSIETILSTIRCPALESMSISCHDPDDLEYPPTSSYLQALPTPSFPLLRSIQLDGMRCSAFAKDINFIHRSPLQTISLLGCTSLMAILRTLLPSTDGIDSGTMWPLLRVIELSYVGAKVVDGICRIVSHRHACGTPIHTIAIDPFSLEKFREKVECMKQHVAVRAGRSGFNSPELTALQIMDATRCLS